MDFKVLFGLIQEGLKQGFWSDVGAVWSGMER